MVELYLFALVAIIICPITLVAVIAAVALNKTLFQGRYWAYLIFSAIGVVSYYIGHRLDTPLVPVLICKELISKLFPFLGWDTGRAGIKMWLLSDLRTTGLCIIASMLSLYLASRTPERMMLEAERRKEAEIMTVRKIDTVPGRSQLVFGCSGSGKTAYLDRMIQDILKRQSDSFIVFLDGKGSTEDYSPFWALNILAKKTGRRLRIINCTANRSIDGVMYDFLDEVVSPNQITDMVMVLGKDPSIQMSSGSEHYQTMTERYILEVVTFLLNHDVDVTLRNLLSVITPDDMESAMDNMKVNEFEKTELLKYMNENWKDVQASIEKIRICLLGEGKQIFTCGSVRTNIRKAYRDGDIVLLLADTMSMPSLAEKVVSVAVMDMRALVANRLVGTTPMDRKVYFILDEFTGFSSSLPLIADIFSRARSADVVTSLSTQSVADLEAIPGNYFERLADSTDRFVVFRQHAGMSSELAASLFGTRNHVTATSRTEDQCSSGQSSNTVDKAYVVSPDQIRNLKRNHGFLLDKNEKDDRKVKYFKNKFIDT